ncbi:MAG: hypothetical protein FWC61_02555 [Proteobacteria bacterium]|nr:hypothetical protein [Pseudomonadota bacterium]
MRAYQEEPWKTTQETYIVEKRNVQGNVALWVSGNIFYPGGGGQPQDKGFLVAPDGKKYPIARGLVLDRQLFLILDLPFDSPEADSLKEDADVVIEIDKERRRRYSRMHTAAHVLMGAVKAVTDGYGPEGIEIAPDGETCAIRFAGTYKAGKSAADAVAIANQVIGEDKKVSVMEFETMEKAFCATKDIFRGKGELKGSVSVVIIEGYDANPCGGTHVETLKDIGSILLMEQTESSITFALRQGQD